MQWDLAREVLAVGRTIKKKVAGAVQPRDLHTGTRIRIARVKTMVCVNPEKGIMRLTLTFAEGHNPEDAHIDMQREEAHLYMPGDVLRLEEKWGPVTRE